MRISAIQMNAGADKTANLAEAGRLIARAAAEGAGLVALPELFVCMGGSRDNRLAAAEVLPAPRSAEAGGPAFAFLAATARQHRIILHGGSLIERLEGEQGAGEQGEGERLANTTLVFGPDGRELARYRKIHLFDTTAHGRPIGESRAYDRGREIVTYEAGGVTVGCAICYDLRFPELFRALRLRGAGLIVLPSAFTLQTGMDHWAPLLRARAIETQCWLMAPALCGRHTEGSRAEERWTYGHTMIIDPWGCVVAEASGGPGLATATLDAALTERIRREMPVMEHLLPGLGR